MKKFYDAELDNMTPEAPKLLMDEGDWKLYDFNGPDDANRHETSSLWHSCPMAIQGNNAHEGIWPVRYMDWQRTDVQGMIQGTSAQWKCAYCYKVPPDKILTLFLLHNFDRLAK
jgi:hypothetical protein